MENVILVLIFVVGILIMIGIFATFCLCMYLREFPKFKRNMKADLEHKTYESTTELDEAQKK